METHYEKYGRAWYEKNKERNAERGRKWADKNKGRRVEITQKYASLNREKVRVYNDEYSRSLAGKYRVYRSSAKKKGNDFQITREEFASMIANPCAYCGGTECIGVDRIDNRLGYTVENTAPCCPTCNYMKKNHTVGDFLAHIKEIYIHNEKH